MSTMPARMRMLFSSINDAVSDGYSPLCKLDRFLLVQGLHRCKCCLCHANQLLIRDGWFAAFADGFGKHFPFLHPAFILGGPDFFLLPLFHGLQRDKIIQHRDLPAAEDFNTFLREGFVAVSEIVYDTDGTVREVKCHRDVVLAIFAAIWQRVGCHGDGRRANQKCDEVHEMTAFANDSSPADIRILSPVVERDGTCIDPVVNVDGLAAMQEGRGKRLSERSEATVEADS